MGDPTKILRRAVLMALVGLLICHGINFGQTIVPYNHLKSGNAAIRLLNLNKSTVDELIRLPGIGVVKAEQIVRGRPYRAKKELLERGILSGRAYRRVRDFIVVAQN